MNKILKDFGTNEKEVDKYFHWLQNSLLSYETKVSYWDIFRNYVQWLTGKKYEYKLQATVKKKLPVILTLKEVVKIVNSTKNSRDRAMLSLMFDSGMRPGEIVNLKLEDCIFDEEGLIVNVPEEGKRGRRRIRVVNTVNSEQSLKEWLKYHEFKQDPYSPVFYNLDKRTKTCLCIESLLKVVKTTSKRANIKKRVNSYTFRHSRATHLAKHLTEQEMKVYFGWTMGSRMVQVYVHLSCRDLDEKVLELNKRPNTKEKKEDLRELIREELLRVLKSV